MVLVLFPHDYMLFGSFWKDHWKSDKLELQLPQTPWKYQNPQKNAPHKLH